MEPPFALPFRVGQQGYEDDAHYVEDANGLRIVEDVTREQAQWIRDKLSGNCEVCGHPVCCPSALHPYYPAA